MIYDIVEVTSGEVLEEVEGSEEEVISYAFDMLLNESDSILETLEDPNMSIFDISLAVTEQATEEVVKYLYIKPLEVDKWFMCINRVAGKDPLKVTLNFSVDFTSPLPKNLKFLLNGKEFHFKPYRNNFIPLKEVSPIDPLVLTGYNEDKYLIYSAVFPGVMDRAISKNSASLLVFEDDDFFDEEENEHFELMGQPFDKGTYDDIRLYAYKKGKVPLRFKYSTKIVHEVEGKGFWFIIDFPVPEKPTVVTIPDIVTFAYTQDFPEHFIRPIY